MIPHKVSQTLVALEAGAPFGEASGVAPDQDGVLKTIENASPTNKILGAVGIGVLIWFTTRVLDRWFFSEEI